MGVRGQSVEVGVAVVGVGLEVDRGIGVLV